MAKPKKPPRDKLTDANRNWRLALKLGLRVFALRVPDLKATYRLLDLLEDAQHDETIVLSPITVERIKWVVEVLESSALNDPPDVIVKSRAESLAKKTIVDRNRKAAQIRQDPAARTKAEALRLHDTLDWRKLSAAKITDEILKDVEAFAKNLDPPFHPADNFKRTLYDWLRAHRKPKKVQSAR